MTSSTEVHSSWMNTAYGQVTREYQDSKVVFGSTQFLYLRVGLDAKGLGQTHLNLSINLIGGVYQSGALFSYANKPKTVNIRVGISFKSTEQACANAESEIGSSTFDEIHAQAKALWQEKLSKIEVDVANTPANVTELLYSSLYRASLTPVRQDSIF